MSMHKYGTHFNYNFGEQYRKHSFRGSKVIILGSLKFNSKYSKAYIYTDDWKMTRQTDRQTEDSLVERVCQALTIKSMADQEEVRHGGSEKYEVFWLSAELDLGSAW